MEELLKAVVKQEQQQLQKLTGFLLQARNSTESFSADGVANSIKEFHYNPDEGTTFAAYYRRYEDIFQEECKGWSSERKVRLLLRKLATPEHKSFCNFILPRKPVELCLEETIIILTNIFSEKSSQFNIRWECLNLKKNESDDFVTYAGMVNKACERFRLEELTPDMFKCIIFVKGLVATEDVEIRKRILSKLNG
ncbi:uncharacterized protein LOC106874916 [Octopus bimaculoides]|uniref:uncharacterized protein LOC106874916 n=1 Tax=Octopus bimaculoides TaxID=37653 RepID=UPI00071CE638|nr:uncharacterized protein LOC106874916 [Octopus bimaculoides]|eukprot:XP_014778320.1 PREDICTED: uncharacterized protein LOC106874916 [Octopus bimaculoides]